jgi:hypothetical protein
MTPAERAALRGLCDAATEGPWSAEAHDVGDRFPEVFVRVPSQSHALVFEDARPRPESPAWEWTHNDRTEQAKRDVAFIAAARTAVPALLDEVERLEAENATMREALEWFADEGRYTGTHRLGATYVDAGGLDVATAALSAAKEAKP